MLNLIYFQYSSETAWKKINNGVQLRITHCFISKVRLRNHIYPLMNEGAEFGKEINHSEEIRKQTYHAKCKSNPPSLYNSLSTFV